MNCHWNAGGYSVKVALNGKNMKKLPLSLAYP